MLAVCLNALPSVRVLGADARPVAKIGSSILSGLGVSPIALVSDDGKYIAWNCVGEAGEFLSQRIIVARTINWQVSSTIHARGVVKRISFVPDRKWVAAIVQLESGACAVDLWEADSGNHLMTVTSAVLGEAIASSSDGRWLAFCRKSGDQSRIVIFDLETNDISRQLEFGDRIPETIEFSVDGDRIAAGRPDRVRIWSGDTGILQIDAARTEPERGITAGGAEHVTQWLWINQTTNVEREHVFSVDRSTLEFAPEFSADLTRVVFSDEQWIRVRDTATGQLVAQHSRSGDVRSGAVFARGAVEALGVVDGSRNEIQILDSRTGEVKHSYVGARGIVTRLSFAARHSLVLASGEYRSYAWEGETSQLTGNTAQHELLRRVAYDSEHDIIATVGGSDSWQTKNEWYRLDPPRIWNISSHDVVASLNTAVDIAYDVENGAFSVFTSDGLLEQRSARTGLRQDQARFLREDQVGIESGLNWRVRQLHSVINSSQFIGLLDGAITVFSPNDESHRAMRRPETRGFLAHVFALSAPSTTGLVACAELRLDLPKWSDSVLVIDLNSGRPIQNLTFDDYPVTTVAMSNTGTLVAVWREAAGEGTISIHSTASGERIASFTEELMGHALYGEFLIGVTPGLNFSPDSKWLAAGGYDGTVRFVGVDDDTIGKVIELSGHEGLVTCVEFGSDGRHVVTGGIDGTVSVWDFAGETK